MAEHTPPDQHKTLRPWAEPASPCSETLGAELLEADEGFCRIRFPTQEAFKQSGGVVQGGFLAAMLDNCLGPCLMSVLAPDQSHATIELKINYFRPVTQGWLIGEARVVRKGAQTVYGEATLTTEDGELVARASTTSLIRPRQ